MRVAPIDVVSDGAIEPVRDVAAEKLSDCPADSLAACEGQEESLNEAENECPVIDALCESIIDNEGKSDTAEESVGAKETDAIEERDAPVEIMGLRDIVYDATADKLTVAPAERVSVGDVDVDVVKVVDGSRLSLNAGEDESDDVSECCADPVSDDDALCTSEDEAGLDTEACEVAVSVRNDDADLDGGGEIELPADAVTNKDRVVDCVALLDRSADGEREGFEDLVKSDESDTERDKRGVAEPENVALLDDDGLGLPLPDLLPGGEDDREASSDGNADGLAHALDVSDTAVELGRGDIEDVPALVALSDVMLDSNAVIE